MCFLFINKNHCVSNGIMEIIISRKKQTNKTKTTKKKPNKKPKNEKKKKNENKKTYNLLIFFFQYKE